MKQLLEAGVHFGHQTRRWNPKMQPFIFMDRNGIHIIDLQQTVTRLNEAYKFVEQLAANGETILFVGTKKQAQEAVAEEAKRCGMYYVNQRWLGGMLTNFQTIQSRIRYLRDLEVRKERGDFERLPKKRSPASAGRHGAARAYPGWYQRYAAPAECTLYRRYTQRAYSGT